MRPPAFLARQWPKRHEWLVEHCITAGLVLHVNDVLPMLTGWHRAIISRWNPPTHPRLTLVPRMGGPFRRWSFLCPRCGARRDALYSLPESNAADWRCRQCHGLIYASQRHGPRHPLSRVLTMRKRVGRRKMIVQQERRRARLMARQSELLAGRPSADTDEEAITMATLLRVQLAQKAEEQAAIVAETRAKIAAEAAASRATLEQLARSASSKSVRTQARRSLKRYGTGT